MTPITVGATRPAPMGVRLGMCVGLRVSHGHLVVEGAARDLVQHLVQDLAQGLAQDLVQDLAPDLVQGLAVCWFLLPGRCFRCTSLSSVCSAGSGLASQLLVCGSVALGVRFGCRGSCLFGADTARGEARPIPGPGRSCQVGLQLAGRMALRRAALFRLRFPGVASRYSCFWRARQRACAPARTNACARAARV